MTDKEIIEALIARDSHVTQQFFFKDCYPLFTSVINNVFKYHVDYDEFVNELYLYLMEDDAQRLRQFQGRSSIYQWLKVVAIRYFLKKRDRMIDSEPEENPNSIIERQSDNEESGMTARMDVESLLMLMQNRRYVYIIRRLVLEDAEPRIVAEELQVSVDNIYNIKKRAIAELTEVALKEHKKYEK